MVKPPVLMAPYSSLSRVLKVGLRSDTLDQMELSEIALWTMRPRLMSVSGVANVAIRGQRDKQFQVLVDPQKLRAAGITLDAITKAAGDAAVISAGGFIDTPNLRLPVNPASPSSPRRRISPAPSSSSATVPPSASEMSRRSRSAIPP